MRAEKSALQEGNVMNKNVWVIPYHKDLGKIGYTMHYSERKAKKWGFKHLAKLVKISQSLKQPKLKL